MRNFFAAALAASLLAAPAAAVQLVSAEANGNVITDFSGDANDDDTLLLQFDLFNTRTATATIGLDDDDASGPLAFSAFVGNSIGLNFTRLRVNLLDGAAFTDVDPITPAFAAFELVQSTPSQLTFRLVGGEPMGVELGGFFDELDQFALDLSGLTGEAFRVAVTAEVPEPATLGLLGLAGLGLVAARRRAA